MPPVMPKRHQPQQARRAASAPSAGTSCGARPAAWSVKGAATTPADSRANDHAMENRRRDMTGSTDTTRCGVPILPGNPPEPCPELLTEAEAIRYLRLDQIGIEEPARTLFYYRRRGLLRATQVGKCIRYRRIELERFLERATESNPR